MARGRLVHFSYIHALIIAVSSLVSLRYGAQIVEYFVPTFYWFCYDKFGLFKRYRNLYRVYEPDVIEENQLFSPTHSADIAYLLGGEVLEIEDSSSSVESS